MKIGEAGEAFFVFETEGDVPEDLITSPILHPTEPPAGGGDVAQDRFGAKRKDEADNIMSEDSDATREPDFLDLNDTSVTSTGGAPLSDLPSAVSARQNASTSELPEEGKTPTSSPRALSKVPSGLSLSRPEDRQRPAPSSAPQNLPNDASENDGPHGAIDRAVNIELSEVHAPDVKYKSGKRVRSFALCIVLKKTHVQT